MKEIADHYLKKIVTSEKYLSKEPVRDVHLLYRPFYNSLMSAIKVFNELYDYVVVIVETYRSDTLQRIYFNRGASKIKTRGMHGFAIAVDCAFRINGKFSYNGNYKHLRQCMKDAGLHLLTSWDIGHVQFIAVSDQQLLRNEVDKAIKSSQKKYGLVVDGLVGPKTIKKSKEIYL